MTLVRRALLLVPAAVLLVLPAWPQGQGVLDGRLVNATAAANTPSGVALDVIGLAGGMNVLKSSVTDSAGRFRIDGLPTNTPLLIRADYKGVYYYGQVNLDAGGKAHLEIQVFDETTSAQGIRLESVRIAFKLTGTGLSSLESYTFNNETKPPRSFMREDGSFRFSKAPGITEPPRLDVTGPGASMPVTQSPLESADGQSYYSRYALRPGITTFDVAQMLPYQNGSYSYRKKFFQDATSLKIGVIPQDLRVSGEGLAKVQTDAAQNFAVYSAGPIKAGTEVVWTLSGGTPVVEAPVPAPEPEAGPAVRPMPTLVGQNALTIGPLLLIGLIMILWYAHKRVIPAAANGKEARTRELRERREQLLNYVASLDAQFESHALDQRAYLRLREQSKRHLRRIATLLAKTGVGSQESEVRRKANS
ncbi:MAG: hypothetical protein LAP85_05320 [Acidobacteriia bacterium]|nr:hypothetical protein [Terriglobia bacterium]